MASDYGLNFGYRVSDETRRWANGRVKTPATGTALLLGTVVEVDNSNAGYLLQSASGAKPRPGTCGLLLQEEVWDRTIYEGQLVDSFLLGIAKLNRLSVITGGAGSKIWLRNTASQTRADGRVIAAATMFATTNIVAGCGLGWDGAKFVYLNDPTLATSFAEVTSYDSTYGRLEAVLRV